jgi:uncharacterized protein (DUF1501 family)
MDRRHFLRTAAGAASLIAARPSWLQALDRQDDAPGARAGRRVVVLMLDGGNDWLDTVVPFADDLYHRARPDLAHAPAKLLALDDTSAMHPALVEMHARFQAGGMAILRGVGHPDPNLSHFRAKDILDSAEPANVAPTSGWLGRLVDARRPDDDDPTALVSVGSVSTPLALRAARHQAYVVPGRTSYKPRVAPAGADARGAEARRRAIERLNRVQGDGRTADVARAVGSAQVAVAALDAALARPPRVPYPDTRLAGQLEVVARVIDAELSTSAFHVAQPGYDTHSSQAATHAGLLAALDGALGAFLRDLEAQGRLAHTLVLVVSEFGRRVAQNGIGATAGTDHGTAGHVWAFGGGVRPGLHGSAPRLDRLDANGNLVHDVDFRCVLGDVVERWFGVPQESVLGARFESTALLPA